MSNRGLDQPHVGKDPGERGGLEILDRVVDTIVRRAALKVVEVERDESTLRTITGRTLPHIDAQRAGDSVRVSMDIAVTWASDVSDVVQRVRTSVSHDIVHMTGLAVDGIDIHVPALIRHPSVKEPERRVQ